MAKESVTKPATIIPFPRAVAERGAARQAASTGSADSDWALNGLVDSIRANVLSRGGTWDAEAVEPKIRRLAQIFREAMPIEPR